MVTVLQKAHGFVGSMKVLREHLDALELEETDRPRHPSSPHLRGGETEAQGGRGGANKSSGGFKKEETPSGWGSEKTPWSRRHLTPFSFAPRMLTGGAYGCGIYPEITRGL